MYLSRLERELDSVEKTIAYFRKIPHSGPVFYEALGILMLRIIGDVSKSKSEVKFDDIFKVIPRNIKTDLHLMYHTVQYDKILKEILQNLKKNRKLVIHSYNGTYELDKFYKQALDRRF